MALDQQTELSSGEVDDFISANETGVLSLARDDAPYSIPISYGYDADNTRFYIRLVSTPGSEKRQFLASDPEARLVVYEADGDTYRSVVATGRLERIPPEELTVDHVEQYGDAKRPLFEIWGRDKPDLDIQLYTLVPESLSGRRIDVDRSSVATD